MAAQTNESDRPHDPPLGGSVFGRRKGKKLRPRQSGRLTSALPALAIDLSAETR